MKALILAAIAALGLGIGAAYAQTLTPPDTQHWAAAAPSHTDHR